MLQILFFNAEVVDFFDQVQQKRVHGLSVKGLEKTDDKIKFSKTWLDANQDNYEDICTKARKLLPGQVIVLQFEAISAKKNRLSDIIASDELAVDFDSIL